MKNDNIKDAKDRVKKHIKFLESLLSHLRTEKEPWISRCMWSTWCLDKYIEERLIYDIEEAMKEQGRDKDVG